MVLTCLIGLSDRLDPGRSGESGADDTRSSADSFVPRLRVGADECLESAGEPGQDRLRLGEVGAEFGAELM